MSEKRPEARVGTPAPWMVVVQPGPRQPRPNKMEEIPLSIPEKFVVMRKSKRERTKEKEGK